MTMVIALQYANLYIFMMHRMPLLCAGRGDGVWINAMSKPEMVCMSRLCGVRSMEPNKALSIRNKAALSMRFCVSGAFYEFNSLC